VYPVAAAVIINDVRRCTTRLIQAPHTPLATLLVTICASAFVAAIGLLIGVASRSEEQATAFSLILMFVLAGLGGAWVPLQFTGTAFQRVARATPGTWVIDAYENVVQRGLGVRSVLLSSSLPIASAAGLVLLAILRSADSQPDIRLGSR
jgi:ABC-type multidrug transport system permease subunit